LAFNVSAQELSEPIVLYTPILLKQADALQLTAEQRQKVQDWVAEMPAKREAVEAQVLALRQDLRSAIAEGAPAADRLFLAKEIGPLETELLMIRSRCADYWREALTSEQFSLLKALAK
jgi:hypothetical protein